MIGIPDRKQLLRVLPRLPNGLNYRLMRANRVPRLLYGAGYRRYRRDVIDAHRESYDNSAALLAMVNHAIARVPYYRDRYGGCRLREKRELAERIGFIDRDRVMAGFEQFLADDLNRVAYVAGTTGGTSGRPLQLLIPRDRHVFELSTMHFLWESTGWRHDPVAVLRNHRLPADRIYQINPLTREVIFDGFRLTDDYLDRVYQTMRHLGIRYLHAYPSAVHAFCTFIRRGGLDPSLIRCAFSGSENVFAYQKELVSDVLGIRFYNWFGHSEKLVLGGYCAATDLYHMEPTYGYFELVDEQGRVVDTPGKSGEIVGTTLHNPGMPLIRYRTGDYAEYAGDHCDLCGRTLPLIRNIRGRWSGERIFNRDGSAVTTTALNLHSDLNAVIDGHQYLQEEPGELVVRIVRSPRFTERHEKRLLSHYRSKLTPDSRVSIVYMERLPRQPNGKFLHLISRVADTTQPPFQQNSSGRAP